MAVRFTRTGVIERGKRDDALAFAATISNYVEETYGTPVSWGVGVGGTNGTLYWYVDYESLAHLEEIFGRSMTDTAYLKLLDEAVDLFRGAAEDTIVYIM